MTKGSMPREMFFKSFRTCASSDFLMFWFYSNALYVSRPQFRQRAQSIGKIET